MNGERTVKTEVKPVAENEVLLAVEIPPDEVQHRYEQTLARLARETSLPGFRKGRVPKQLLLQRLGPDYVLNETLREFLPEWYDSALSAASVEAVSMPELDFQEISAGKPFSFTAKVQVRPTPTLGEYKGLQVPKRQVEVTDSQIDANLAMLQERFASLAPVDDRPVQQGDFVIVDLRGVAEGRPIEGATATDYMLQVGSGQLIPGFEDHLIGASRGEHKEHEVTFPDDYRVEELQGKPGSFAVDIKEIKQKTVPELGDTFAQDVSEFETLEELRRDIRERLGRAQAAAAEREYRGHVVDQAVRNATLTVPSAMVEREAHALYHDLETAVGEQGVTMEVYLKAMEKTPVEVEEELKPRAEMNVRRRLVLDAIRAAEAIEVTDEELRARIKADAELLGRDGDQLVLDVYASGRQSMIRDELLMAKTVDYLVDQSVPTEMTPEQAAEDEDEAAHEASHGEVAATDEELASAAGREEKDEE